MDNAFCKVMIRNAHHYPVKLKIAALIFLSQHHHLPERPTVKPSEWSLDRKVIINRGVGFMSITISRPW